MRGNEEDHMQDNQNMKYDVIIIGGGASGMLAAGCAAENGARVLLLERNKHLGKKLRITGKGRCNLTNTCETAEFVESYGKNGKFLYRALTEFSNHDLVRFFKEQGVATKEERGGRIFPVSDRAVDVVRALEGYMDKHKVTVKLNARVVRITIDPESNAVTGVTLKNSEEILEADKIILATGGLSYPGTGSTGDGYAMAKRLGHSIVPLQPALVPFETEEEFPKDMQGLSLENVEVTVLCGGKRVAAEFGDMLFTHFGVSGPIILKLSGRIVKCLDTKKPVVLSINLKPALDETKLTNRFLREFSGSGKKSLKTLIKGMLPKSLVPVFIEASTIPEDKRCNQITGDERKTLVDLMMDFRVTVKRARSYAEAIITRGGIDLKEIDPRTMESKKVKGLYFCGEIIDIDGITGGYNLQAAFSTGYLAAKDI
jgi:predicted Rossmann fold flavoprotein